MPMVQGITPYRKRSASKSIKRKYARRRLFAPNEVSAIRIPPARVAGFPNKLRTKLRYVESIAANPTATTVAGGSYKLNGLLDPTVAVGGHQPLGFDNYMAVYGRFEVIKANIKWSLINATDNHMLIGFVIADSTQTFPSSPNVLMEMGKNCVYRLCHGSGSSLQIMPYVQRSYDIAKELGIALGDDTLRGNASNDPGSGLYANCFVGTIDGSDITAQQLLVEIEYDVVFDQPLVNQPLN